MQNANNEATDQNSSRLSNLKALGFCIIFLFIFFSKETQQTNKTTNMLLPCQKHLAPSPAGPRSLVGTCAGPAGRHDDGCRRQQCWETAVIKPKAAGARGPVGGWVTAGRGKQAFSQSFQLVNGSLAFFYCGEDASTKVTHPEGDLSRNQLGVALPWAALPALNTNTEWTLPEEN